MSFVKQVAAKASDVGANFIDAPVSGGKQYTLLLASLSSYYVGVLNESLTLSAKQQNSPLPSGITPASLSLPWDQLLYCPSVYVFNHYRYIWKNSKMKIWEPGGTKLVVNYFDSET